MEPFQTITSVVTPLDRVNVDTDAIIPKQFLKRTERSGFGQFLFYEWRFKENGQMESNFELNKPCYKGSNILIARANFGCGSSREHAPWALLDYGFRVVIAPSFAEIFYNNCYKNGILLIELPEKYVDEIFKRVNEKEVFKLTIDLEDQIIHGGGDFFITFDIDSYRRECLLKGLDDIKITMAFEERIRNYEKKVPNFYSIK